jgi:hypothetical protein
MSQTLSDKLAAFKAAFIQRAPEQIRHVIQQANDDLRASGVLDRSVKVGDQLSAFELPNQDGAIIRSDDLLARGPLVLSFFAASGVPIAISSSKLLAKSPAICARSAPIWW